MLKRARKKNNRIRRTANAPVYAQRDIKCREPTFDLQLIHFILFHYFDDSAVSFVRFYLLFAVGHLIDTLENWYSQIYDILLTMNATNKKRKEEPEIVQVNREGIRAAQYMYVVCMGPFVFACVNWRLNWFWHGLTLRHQLMGNHRTTWEKQLYDEFA